MWESRHFRQQKLIDYQQIPRSMNCVQVFVMRKRCIFVSGSRKCPTFWLTTRAFVESFHANRFEISMNSRWRWIFRSFERIAHGCDSSKSFSSKRFYSGASDSVIKNYRKNQSSSNARSESFIFKILISLLIIFWAWRIFLCNLE